MAPISLDGDDVTGITIDGDDVQEVTMDGDVVWTAVPPSRVSRYEFEQDLTDSWGDNDGTDNTSAGYNTDSQVGTYSKQFDGTDDYIDLPFAPSQLGTFSVALWFYLDKIQSVLIEDIDRDNETGFQIFFTSDEELEVGAYDTTGTSGFVTITGFSPQWYHGIVAVDSGDEIRYYSDGSLSASNTIGTTAGSALNARIGAALIDGAYYSNLIDDLRIYDKALTDTEASNLYNTGSING